MTLLVWCSEGLLKIHYTRNRLPLKGEAYQPIKLNKIKRVEIQLLL